jgi:hypothetical protein
MHDEQRAIECRTFAIITRDTSLEIKMYNELCQPLPLPRESSMPRYITTQEHDRRIAVAQDQLDSLHKDPDWQHAVAPNSHNAIMSVYVVTPEQSTPEADLRRRGADALNGVEFARKDGDDIEETNAKFATFGSSDIRVAVVAHDDKGRSEMVSAVRLVQYSPATSSPAIDSITETWEQEPHEALARVKLPNGQPASTLLGHPGVYDLSLASTAAHWAVKANPRGSQALMALYKASLAIVAARGGQYIVGAMDVEGVFKQLHGRGSEAWVDAFPDDHRTVQSSVEGSNISTFAICDTFQWKWDLQHNPVRRFRYGMLWGADLDARGVEFHGLNNGGAGSLVLARSVQAFYP